MNNLNISTQTLDALVASALPLTAEIAYADALHIAYTAKSQALLAWSETREGMTEEEAYELYFEARTLCRTLASARKAAGLPVYDV